MHIGPQYIIMLRTYSAGADEQFCMEIGFLPRMISLLPLLVLS